MNSLGLGLKNGAAQFASCAVSKFRFFMSIGCLGILLGAISGAGAIRDNGGLLGARDDLLTETELEHDFASEEVHVKPGNTDLQTKKWQSRSKGKKDVEEIQKVESPGVDDASMKSADFDQLQGEVKDEDRQMREAAAGSPVWRDLMQSDLKRGIHLFQKLIGDNDVNVRIASAVSPAWVPLLEKDLSKGIELLHYLIADSAWDVRKESARSPAWVPLLEKNPLKGTELFQKLIKDRDEDVRRGSAKSSAWVPLLKADGSKWIQSLHFLGSPALSEDVCKAMTERQNTSMNHYFHNFPTEDLLEAALLLSEASADCMAKLGFTVALTERVRKSADSSFLSKLLEVKLWAKLAGGRLLVLAEEKNEEIRKEKKKVEEERERALQAAKKWAKKAREFAEIQSNAALEIKKQADMQAYAAAMEIRKEKRRVEGILKGALDMAEVQQKKIAETSKKIRKEKVKAEKERERALKAEKEAKEKRQLAEKEKKSAEEAKKDAETQRKKAVTAAEEIQQQKMKADKERERALKAEKETEKKRQLAEKEKKSAEEAKKDAEKQRKKAESQREIAVILVIALLALGTLTVFSGILWYFYPAICQWRDESLGRCDCWRFKLHPVPSTL